MSSNPDSLKALIPTKEVIQTLPVFYVVALAIRVVERIAPLASYGDPSRASYFERIQNALDYAREIATTGTTPHGGEPISMTGGTFNLSGPFFLTTLSSAVKAALKPTALSAFSNRKSDVVAGFIQTCELSIETLDLALFPPRWGGHQDPPIEEVSIKDSLDLLKAIQLDVDMLRHFANEYKWADETLVNFDFLGALWPGEPPTWWSEPNTAINEIVDSILVEVSVPATAEEASVNDAYVDYLCAMNRLHVAFGGRGLRVIDHCTFETARESSLIGGPHGSDEERGH
jgi:hypothetical protein